jgi:ubiquinone/menaquinone biosynthesis C-methylase UbiE
MEPHAMTSGAGRRAAPPAPLRSFFRQFGLPRGRVGALAGRVMARRNREVNRWAVDTLAIAPGERVLDVGCGPGVAISLAARPDTTVAGVDPSDVMVTQARRRNRRAIAAGLVTVDEGAAERLPFPDASFDAVLAVNSLSHWRSRDDGLREVARVLAPGGGSRCFCGSATPRPAAPAARPTASPPISSRGSPTPFAPLVSR